MKKSISLLLALSLTAALAGCSAGSKETTAAPETSQAESTEAGSSADPDASAPNESASDESASDGQTVIRVGSLKGPTSMGLARLMEQNEAGETSADYAFTMMTAADELTAKMVTGELDIALIPANAASILYQKTGGQIAAVNINTLGVLDIVASDDSIQTIGDLKGKTLYLTGKGTTPDYAIRYLLSANGLTDSDVTLEYKSEAAEVAAILKEQPDAIGLLPQPFVTAACMQNESLKIVLDLTKEWQAVQGEGGSQLVTGVTVASRDFIDAHPDMLQTFLEEHKASALYANEHPEETAELIAAAGIVEKAPIALKALPYCNIVSITDGDMETALSGYLQVLFDQEPKSVGGALPDSDFYYVNSAAE